MDQAEAYHNLITSIRPSSLARLTAHDDQILAAFEAVFPEIALDDERLKKISEDEMKSPEGKEKWRGLMKGFENIGQSSTLDPSTCYLGQLSEYDHSHRLQFRNPSASGCRRRLHRSEFNLWYVDHLSLSLFT